jgi:hypothetical protein
MNPFATFLDDDNPSPNVVAASQQPATLFA